MCFHKHQNLVLLLVAKCLSNYVSLGFAINGKFTIQDLETIPVHGSIVKEGYEICRLSLNEYRSGNCPNKENYASFIISPVSWNASMTASSKTENNSIPLLRRSEFSLQEAWIACLVSLWAISFTSLSGCILWPLVNSSFFVDIINTFTALATSGLLCTSLFQILPQVVDLPKDSHTSLLTVVLMISVIYMAESLFQVILHREQIESAGNIELPDHAHNSGATDDRTSLVITGKETELSQNMQENVSKPKISTSFWLVVIGKIIHSSVDGFVVSSSYCKSFKTGLSISIAICLEEISHSLGDTALFLELGLSITNSLKYSFCISLGGFLGAFICFIGGHVFASTVTACSFALFLYTTLVHLIHHLKHALEKSLKCSKKRAIYVLLQQGIGIILGILIMYNSS